MNDLDPVLLANLLYLLLVAGAWLAAMALATPGTGFLELMALLALAGGAVGMMTLPVSLLALVVLVLGAAMFAFAVIRRRSEWWLLGAGLAVSGGSTFLFQRPGGGAAVHPLLAVLVSAGTLGFFWLVIRKTLAALRAGPTFDPAAIVGLVGEARTPLAPTGSVYVGGELWSAWAPRPVAAGAQVRVTKADGLFLEVESIEATTPKEG